MATAAVSAVRAYVRWAPGQLGKRALVDRLVEPRLLRLPHLILSRQMGRGGRIGPG